MTANSTTALSNFRRHMDGLMRSAKARPFLCEGNPLNARAMIVGFNPATTMEKDFWSYWDDAYGFDKEAFMADYSSTRKLAGARPRIQAFANAFPDGWCIETNICSKPTPKAKDLDDKSVEAFRYLFDQVRPQVVFVHSKEPIAFFREMTGVGDFNLTPVRTSWHGHEFLLCGRPGPLWTFSLEAAAMLGSELAGLLYAPESSVATADGSLDHLAFVFAERFRMWGLRLPRDDVEKRRGGEIRHEGWHVAYNFGEVDGFAHIDYYASHRMLWDDEAMRILDDGTRIRLPPRDLAGR